MRRKFTVYGLRFSKTSFWNRINTGFTDPAVATARTACGIETFNRFNHDKRDDELQQRVPLAVLKQFQIQSQTYRNQIVATARTACGIETHQQNITTTVTTASCNSAYRLRY